MLLNGSEIESNSSRSEFKFESKFRISPRCFGVYDGRTVFDMEEVVISTMVDITTSSISNTVLPS